MLKRLRERAGSESGFTLIELLVVMLILGILAAIAIPAFFNQRDKANDSAKKTEVRTMQTAMETCATDNNGQYSNCNLTALRDIEPTIPSGAPAPTVGTDTFTVRSTTASGSGNWYQIARANDGVVTRTCTNAGKGGCRTADSAGNMW
jgi:type IV pilus assembly protein PilA